MRINPIQPTIPFKRKMNTGVLMLVGMFVSSCTGAYILNKDTSHRGVRRVK